ncbi:MAG: glycosyltransferase family 4 protein [Candidatus Altiarchaeales archaeon]|nr:glycosyltransferase family 4 protein [Candidatus Altiarchaeales archaeon]
MNIALVTSFYDESVAQNEFYLAKYLVKLGHTVSIYTSRLSPPWVSKGKTLSGGSSLSGVEVCRMGSFGMKTNVFIYLNGLRNLLKDSKPDVIHFQEWLMPSITSTHGLGNVVVTARKHDVRGSLPFLLLCETYGRWVFRHAKISTALSKAAKDIAVKYCSAKEKEIVVVPNGVDVEVFKPLETSRDEKNFVVPYDAPLCGTPTVVLAVSRLAREKGLDTLIRACSQIECNFKLLIAGFGPELENLRQLSKNAGVSDRVEFLGFVGHEKLPELYSQADVFVQPSMRDPFPHTILEALACGRPVISSDVSGGLDDVVAKEVGLRFQPGNVSQLKDCLDKMADKTFRNSIAKNCRKFAVEKFGWERIAGEYIKVYEKVL